VRVHPETLTSADWDNPFVTAHRMMNRQAIEEWLARLMLPAVLPSSGHSRIIPTMRTLLSLLTAFVLLGGDASAASRPNLLLITVDDMSADSLGAFGCKLADTSPHIDRLAAQGMRFDYAHVVVGNCMPSRNVMWSGRYPHNNGVEGFYQVKEAKHPHLVDVMKAAGYFTGIRHKISHSTPYTPYGWDVELDTAPDGKKRHVKDAKSYGESTAQGIRMAKEAGKPFCLVMNVADPHKPFYAEGNRGQTVPDPHVPSRVFTPEEVPVPGFLFDDPVVRKELAHYYSSVRRADDCVGEIIQALDASGERRNTVIMFLSDHGMPLPFAKTQVYHHSSNTPLFFLWPGVTKPGAVDREHMVSAVDFLPTLLDIAGVKHPSGMDGRSFAPLLRGEKQSGRDFVVKEYNENAGGSRDPMRALQTKEFLYIYNPWSNGKRVMATATTGTSTYRRMAELAKTDTAIAARHHLYQHRVVEELYAIDKDPDALHNLINSPAHADALNRLRSQLDQWMIQTKDPMLEVFRKRDDAAFREAYVSAQEQEAEDRRANKGRKRDKAKQAPDEEAAAPAAGKAKKRSDLIALVLPTAVTAGHSTVVKIEHRLPANLGEQKLHVTIKGGPDNQRLDRKIVPVSGNGVAEVRFEVPASVPADTVSFAAFVGEEFSVSLQHVQSGSFTVK
jgi:N-sulfoglucosamine sulfohydrolase